MTVGFWRFSTYFQDLWHPCLEIINMRHALRVNSSNRSSAARSEKFVRVSGSRGAGPAALGGARTGKTVFFSPRLQPIFAARIFLVTVAAVYERITSKFEREQFFRQLSSSFCDAGDSSSCSLPAEEVGVCVSGHYFIAADYGGWLLPVNHI
jgi:hypothetical protein